MFFNLISFQRSIINPKTSKNRGNYTVFQSTMKLTHFAISRRGAILRSKVLVAALKKKIESLPLFEAKVKEVLLTRDNDLLFF